MLCSVAVVLVLLPVLSTAIAPSAAQPASSASGCARTPVRNGIAANITWNGVNVCSYSSASSSLGVDFSQTEHIHYNWTAVRGAAVSVSDARLEMFYFGFALVTRDQIASSPETGNGSFDMSWTPGALTYVVEGLYGLTASLIAPNGTALWSEHFFVTATAPYSILAVLPILLLVIAIYEAYSLATAGREAEPRRGPIRPPPAEHSEDTTAPAPEESEPPGAEPPASEGDAASGQEDQP